MNRPKDNDDKEKYLTYSIVIRAGDTVNEIAEETVTKKMAKFFDGGPKEFLEWTHHFSQLAKLKQWNEDDKIMNAKVLLEGDILEAFEHECTSTEEGEEGDVTMPGNDFTRHLYNASSLVMPVDYGEKIQEELWEIRKLKSETLAEYNKRFRTLVRLQRTHAELSQQAKMTDDALCRLYKRGLPYDWQNKYDTSGQVLSSIASLMPYFERIEQGELRLHGRQREQDNKKPPRQDSNRGSGRCGGRGYNGNNNRRRGNNTNNNNRGRNNRSNSNDTSNSSSNKYCSFHRTNSHSTQECRALQNNQQEEHQQVEGQRNPLLSSRNQGPRTTGSRRSDTRVEPLSSRNESSSDDEYLFVGLHAPDEAPSPPMRATIKLENGREQYCALFDSGCSRSLISNNFLQVMQQHNASVSKSTVEFDLAKGTATSAGSLEVRFRIPRLKRDSIIVHRFEVLPSIRDDMVIGRDIMSALGIILDFKNRKVLWDGSEMNIVTGGKLREFKPQPDDTCDDNDEVLAGDDKTPKPIDLLPQHLDSAL